MLAKKLICRSCQRSLPHYGGVSPDITSSEVISAIMEVLSDLGYNEVEENDLRKQVERIAAGRRSTNIVALEVENMIRAWPPRLPSNTV